MMDIDVTKSFRRTRIVQCYLLDDAYPVGVTDLKKQQVVPDKFMVARITKDDFFEPQGDYFIFNTRKEAEKWVSKQKVGELIEKVPLGVGSIKSIFSNIFDENSGDISFLAKSIINFDNAYPKCAKYWQKLELEIPLMAGARYCVNGSLLKRLNGTRPNLEKTIGL